MNEPRNINLHFIVRFSFSISLAFVCWICLSALGDRLPVLYKVPCAAICGLGILRWDSVLKALKGSTVAWFRELLFIALAFYTSMAFGGIYLLDSANEFSFVGGKTVFLCLSLIWSYVFVRTLCWLLLKPHRTHPRCIQHNLRAAASIFLPGILISLTFLYAFNPAITSYDSQLIYGYALNYGTEVFTMPDWQPPVYVFIVGGLLKLWNNLTFLVVLQIIFYWYVVTKSVLFFYKQGISKVFLLIILLWLGLSYSTQIQLSTFWKDIPYGTSILWLTVLLWELKVDNTCKFTRCIELFACIFMICFFRQNGILIVGFLVVALPILYRRKRLFLLSALMVVSFIVIKGPIYKANNVVSQPAMKYYAMANDILNTYFATGNADPETEVFVEKMIEAQPTDQWRNNNLYYNRYGYEGLAEYKIQDFLRLYLANLANNPREMLTVVLRRTQIIWSITKNGAETLNLVNYIDEVNNRDPELYPHRKENLITRMLTDVIGFFRKDFNYYVIFWRPGVSHLLFLLSLSCMLMKKEMNKWKCFLPFVPILLNVFSLIVSSGWPDYRYQWPSVITTWVLLCICMLLANGGEEHTSRNYGTYYSDALPE